MQKIHVFQMVIVSEEMAYDLLYHTFYMMNRKQIDNLSKYCYDISKLVIGVAVIGNLVSDKFSLKALLMGLVCTFIFLIFGYLLDNEEAEQND